MSRRKRFEKIESTTNNEIVRVVISTRISVDRDTEQSIKNQLRECRAYAKAQGWEIVGEFADRGKSAFKLDVERPEFDKAMRMIETGKANRLLIWKLDRMTRNARGFMRIHDRLTEWGATFNSVSEPWFDTSTPIGLALVMLMAALAQMEAEGIQGRALSWHMGRFEMLLPPTGNRPFGYKRPEANKLAIIEREQNLVEEMAARILAGDALREIARDFTSRKIKTASGCETWSHTTIRSVMLNPTTAALIEVSPNEFVRSPHWEPLIPREMWEAIRAVLTDASRCSHIEGGKDARKLKHMLPGLMTCGKCGGRMVTQSHTRGRQYGCPDCDMSIMGDVADRVVTDWIMTNVTVAQWDVMRAAGKGRDSVEEIQGRINELFIERTTHPDRVPRAIYDQAMTELENQLAAANADADIPMPDVPNLGTGWDGMSVHDKRTVIGAVIDSITVRPYAKGCTGDNRIVIEGANR